MKAFKIISLSILVLFLGFVVWMNLTPGHFHPGTCGCGVSYGLEKKEVLKPGELSICSVVGQCINKFWVFDLGKLMLSNLDFNK